MAQKETIEFVAKVDDQTNQVVPTSQTNTPVPKSPVVPVDPQAGLQETINASLSKEVAEGTLEELIQSSIAREAQLRVLREINQSIKNLEANPASPPPPGDPPTDIPTGFFDPEDNGEIPDLQRLAQEQQDAIDDLIRSFDKIDNGSIDSQRFDETTAEFDKTFADMDAVEDALNSFSETTDTVANALSFLGPEIAALAQSVKIVVKVATGLAAALTSVVVASQLYSSVLAATIENFGELSGEVQRAQAKTEAARIQQQARFAQEFGDALADLEEGRNRQRESQRNFLAGVLEYSKPWLDSFSAGFSALYDTLNLILAIISPLIEVVNVIAQTLEAFFKMVSGIANTINPFNWFESPKRNIGVGVWENLTAPENVGLDISGLKPRNINGRDVFDQEDLLRKNS